MVERAGGLAHGGGEGGDLLDRLAADTQGGDGGGDLGRGRLAAQAGGEEGVGLVRRQDAAVDQLGQQGFETVSHQTITVRLTLARSRKLASRSWPCSVAMDSGWNWTPWIGRVL